MAAICPGLDVYKVVSMATSNGDHQISDQDDVIKWKHFSRYWPFVRGIHRSPVNSPHKGQWRGALKFSLICAWIYGWVNYCGDGDLRHHQARYDVTVMGLIYMSHYGPAERFGSFTMHMFQ